MHFVNKDNLQEISAQCSPLPDLLEFAAGSDVSKQEISFVLGKSNWQSLVSLRFVVH